MRFSGLTAQERLRLVKMLCGLTVPTSGDAFINDLSVKSNLAEVKKLIGVSPQETAVAMNLSVKENLELICGVHGFNKEKTKNKIDELTERFQFEEVFLKKASKLSGGWQRKLSIAMALAGEPRVLFLDEPTLGLDVIARSELWEHIQRMKGEITVVLTTHYMQEAEHLSDKVGIMKSGRLLALGTPMDLKEKQAVGSLEDAFISIIRGN